MKLKDHVLKEHRIFRVKKDGKIFAVRIVDSHDSSYPFAKILRDSYGIKERFVMDIWDMYYLWRSRRYILGARRGFYGFDTFEDCIAFLKKEGYKIIHPRHGRVK